MATMTPMQEEYTEHYGAYMLRVIERMPVKPGFREIEIGEDLTGMTLHHRSQHSMWPTIESGKFHGWTDDGRMITHKTENGSLIHHACWYVVKS